MKTIFYSVDLQNLLDIQKKETLHNIEKIKQERVEFLERKERLLKIVLPLIHGLVVLHNNKCNSSSRFNGESLGLLGYGKVDLQKSISLYVDEDFMFSKCGGTTSIEIGDKKIKVWLNDSKSSTMRVTPHLGYSMTTFKNGSNPYGNGIEEELKYIAKYCSRYTDEG